MFRFENPGKVTLHTEYILYDLISMVGNVGGTLGLFIGFSFTGLIAFALQSFLKIMEYIEKRSNKITEQQETSIGKLTEICEYCALHKIVFVFLLQDLKIKCKKDYTSG